MIGNNLYKNSKKKNLLPKILAASLVLVSQLPVDSYALPKNDTTKTKKKSLIINKGDAKVAVPTLGFVLLFCVGGQYSANIKKHCI